MVSQSTYIPARGDLVWLEFNPQVGHEQASYRPALCVSPREYNGKVGLALFCPVTTQVKGYPFEVLLPPGLGVSGVILSDYLKNLDWRARQAKFICLLPHEPLQEVLSKLRVLL